MNNMFVSWKKSLWILGMFVMAACTTGPEIADEGSTEETNAAVLWEFNGTVNYWHVANNSQDKIVANRVIDGLSGSVNLSSLDEDGYPMASISLGLAPDDGSKDLSGEKGICIVYSSDFDIFVEIDFGEETNELLDFNGPMLYMPASATVENHCRRWDDLFLDDEKSSTNPEDLTEVKALRLIFVSEDSDVGASGEFKIVKVTRYVEPVELYGTSGKYQVNKSSNSLVAKSFYWDPTTTDSKGRVLTGSKDPSAGRWYYYSGLHERDSTCFDFYGYDVHGFDTDFSPMYEEKNALVMVANSGTYELDSADYAIIGFDIVNEKQEGTDVSAWKGLCMSFYSEEDDFQVILDVSNKDGETDVDNSWYVDVKGGAYRHWAKIAWEAFKPNNPNGESFESAMTHASRIQLKFYADDMKFILYKLGSYDQCGE